jgi:hypothetical protein
LTDSQCRHHVSGMSAAISFEFSPEELRLLRSKLTAKPVIRALRKAGSTALRDMRSETSKRVRQRKRIKAGVIAKALRMRRAKGSRIEDMEWSLDVSNRPFRVSDYPHRQTKRGVSVAINRGKRSLIRGAFLATLKSGHKGVFLRRGARRLPIDEQFASRVTDAVSHRGEIEAIHRRGLTSLRATMTRVLPMEMAKGA